MSDWSLPEVKADMELTGTAVVTGDDVSTVGTLGLHSFAVSEDLRITCEFEDVLIAVCFKSDTVTKACTETVEVGGLVPVTDKFDN